MADGKANVQIVKRFLEDFLTGNVPGLLKALAENVEWIYPGEPDIYFAGNYRGQKEVAEFFRRLSGSVEILEFSTSEIVGQGDTVVAMGYFRGYALSTENDFESDWVMVFHLKDGKIARCQTYLDTARMGVAFFVA